jgi:hypothetical protein
VIIEWPYRRRNLTSSSVKHAGEQADVAAGIGASGSGAAGLAVYIIGTNVETREEGRELLSRLFEVFTA